MRELDVQNLICKAVNAKGGFAKKLSHRFLVGVPDLLVKMPKPPAALIEVKWREAPRDPAHKFTLEVTKPQELFLRDARRAGMVTGVCSAVSRRSALWLCFMTLGEALHADFTLDAAAHVAVGSNRDADIANQVEYFLTRGQE